MQEAGIEKKGRGYQYNVRIVFVAEIIIVLLLLLLRLLACRNTLGQLNTRPLGQPVSASHLFGVPPRGFPNGGQTPPTYTTSQTTPDAATPCPRFALSSALSLLSLSLSSLHHL